MIILLDTCLLKIETVVILVPHISGRVPSEPQTTQRLVCCSTWGSLTAIRVKLKVKLATRTCNTFRNIAAKRVENVRSNRLFLLNKHFAHSLRAIISCEHFKSLCALIFYPVMNISLTCRYQLSYFVHSVEINA